MIGSAFLMALRELKRNTLRSILTMLGIVIGVSAVIALVTIGNGATASVKNEIGKLGDSLLIVSPGAGRRQASFTQAAPFTMDDVDAIRREVSHLKFIAPAASSQQLVVSGNLNYRTSVTGTTNEFLDARSYQIAEGRSFTDAEVEGGRSLCIIGNTVRTNLLPTGTVVGATLRVGSTTCEVIGLLQSKGQSGGGMDQDDVILMPIRTVQRRLLGSNDVATVYLSADGADVTASVQRQVTSLLRQRRRVPRGAEDDFSVRDMQEIAETMSAATGTLTALLSAIAAVSLLVGGIGIMNIMLVNVTERTREIGIRLAIGALARDVLIQFLVEAVVLSVLGGLIGMALGLVASFLVTRSLKVPYAVDPGILMLAFGFSAAVGVLFGYLPAHKAARLSPMEALRHE